MSNNLERNLGGKSSGVNGNGDYNLHLFQTNYDNGSESDRDDDKQGSAQSSVGTSSTQPDTSDDTTSDECKPSSIQTEDGDYEVHNVERKPPASHHNMNKSFSTQLMDMLNSETDAGGNAVQWLSDGTGFIIRDQNNFERQVLPRYFGSPCIFQSFVRRLYRYDLLCLFYICCFDLPIFHERCA